MAMGNGKGNNEAKPTSKGNQGQTDLDRGSYPMPSGSPMSARKTGKTGSSMSAGKNSNLPNDLVRRAPEGSRTV